MKKIFTIATIVALFVSAQAKADFIETSMIVRTVTQQETEDTNSPAPVGGFVFEFLTTTDGDILSIGNIEITTPSGEALFQHSFGTDSNPPNAGLIPSFPGLNADTWITTPDSNTAFLGGDLPGDGNLGASDLVDSGPQTDFVFARLTVPESALGGVFSGKVTIAGANGPYSQEFSYRLVPEPSSFVLLGVALVGFVGLIRRKRS